MPKKEHQKALKSSKQRLWKRKSWTVAYHTLKNNKFKLKDTFNLCLRVENQQKQTYNDLDGKIIQTLDKENKTYKPHNSDLFTTRAIK